MLQATDFLRGDVAVKGGITTLVKTAHLAEAFRMNYEVHHGGNSLNNVANLHVIAAIRNTTFFEVLLPDGAQKYGLEQDIEVGRDGMVHVPNGAGPRRRDRLRADRAQEGRGAVADRDLCRCRRLPGEGGDLSRRRALRAQGLRRQQLLHERAARSAASSWSW